MTATALSAGRVLRIPLEQLRSIIGEDITLSEVVIRAFLLRHALLQRLATGPKVIGSRYSSDTRYLIDEIERNPAIAVHYRSEVRRLVGDRRLSGIVVEGAGRKQEHLVTGLFSFIGAQPNTSWLDGAVERDDHGFVVTGLDLDHVDRRWQPLPLETSVPGVFCAGDARHGSIKRVATAVGEGAMAVRLVHERRAAPAPSG